MTQTPKPHKPIKLTNFTDKDLDAYTEQARQEAKSQTALAIFKDMDNMAYLNQPAHNIVPETWKLTYDNFKELKLKFLGVKT